MFDWKIIVTSIVVLLIILVFISIDPTVSNFFNSVFDKVSGLFRFEIFNEGKNIKFYLNVSDYKPINFKTNIPTNITLQPIEFYAVLKDGSINTTKTIRIINFKGSGYIGNTINLDGNFEKLEIGEIGSFSNSRIKADGTFSSVIIENIGLKNLKIENSTGSLIVNETEIAFSLKTIEIVSPFGQFSFSKGMSIDGFANKISIPEEKIILGY
ncbi:MAG: hypothetical protein QXD48_00740 [Candidatus Aenigmatarchaeota archaeon]